MLDWMKADGKKQMSLYLCQRSSGNKLKEIGDLFCIGESSVSQAARRSQARIRVDKEFRNSVEEIGRRLNLSIVKN